MSDFQLPQITHDAPFKTRFYFEALVAKTGDAFFGLYFDESLPRKQRRKAYAYIRSYFRREYPGYGLATTGRGYSLSGNIDRAGLKPEHQRLYDESLADSLYATFQWVAEQITNIDPDAGFFAQRKVEHVSADSPLATLVTVGQDLALIADKLGTGLAQEAIKTAL